MTLSTCTEVQFTALIINVKFPSSLNDLEKYMFCSMSIYLLLFYFIILFHFYLVYTLLCYCCNNLLTQLKKEKKKECVYITINKRVY